MLVLLLLDDSLVLLWADDLTHAWEAHRLRLPLSKFERLPRDVVLFRVLDRVQVRRLLCTINSRLNYCCIY